MGEAEKGRLTVILEQGAPLQMIQLLQSPWEDRFRVSLSPRFLLLLLLPPCLICDFKPSGAAGHGARIVHARPPPLLVAGEVKREGGHRRTFETAEGPTSVPGCI